MSSQKESSEGTPSSFVRQASMTPSNSFVRQASMTPSRDTSVLSGRDISMAPPAISRPSGSSLFRSPSIDLSDMDAFNIREVSEAPDLRARSVSRAASEYPEEISEVAFNSGRSSVNPSAPSQTLLRPSAQEIMTEAFDPYAFDEHFGLLQPEDLIVVRPYKGDDDDQVLEELRPKFIVMYDPDPGFIRRIEVSR